MLIGRNKNLSWTNFYKLSAGILIGAGFGSSFVINVDAGLLKNILAIFVSFMALRLFINIKMPRASQESHFIYFNVSGGVIGYLSSIFGIGGGIFSVPLLKISGMEMTKAVGTGAACAFPIAVISWCWNIYMLGLGQGRSSRICIWICIYLSLLCITIFSSFSFKDLEQAMTHKLNDNFLQFIFAAHLVPMFLYWFFAK